MSTLTLVILATLTAIAALAALTFIRWRERVRLERARNIVRHSDFTASLNALGSDLQPWISVSMLNFLGSSLQRHAKELQKLGAPDNRKIRHALDNAVAWQSITKNPKSPLPSDPIQSQNLRNTVRGLYTYLREAYKDNKLTSQEAKALLQEAKVLSLKSAIVVLNEKSGTAIKLNNHLQAAHYLKKTEELLLQQKELPEEFAPLLAEIQKRLRFHEAQRQQPTTKSRLEESAALLSAEDNSWKKKRFD